MEFVHLHIHSEYSILDSTIRIKELIARAKELNMKTLALTDNSNLFNALNFFVECKNAGIKPIIGCDVNIAKRTRFDKEYALDRETFNLVLLVKNEVGYTNLCKILTYANEEGFFLRPRVDIDLLKKYSEGLIVLSGNFNSEIYTNTLEDFKKAEDVARKYKEIFSDNFYLELNSFNNEEQENVNLKIIELAKKLDIKLVATNDVHFLKKEDFERRNILIAIKEGIKLSELNTAQNDLEYSKERYLKSTEEMMERFSYIKEAMENTLEIAEKCNFEFEFSKTKYPKYIINEEIKNKFKYETNDEFSNEKLLDNLINIGVKKRYLKEKEELDKKIIERIEYEKKIIKQMGYIDYFLIVWDFVHFAKTHNILVGPGRGSGAGSIIAYLIEITDIDPIKYNLIFERFLNPQRVSMPDFDIDFASDRRDEVIEYVKRKYVDDHVARIITFGTMSARMAIRDVCRVLNVPIDRATYIANLVLKKPKITIDQALESSKEFKYAYLNDKEVKNIIDIAKSVELMPRNISIHACGVVITKEKTMEYVPLYLSDNILITQFTMIDLEKLGLLKMDFLGIRMLSVISDTIEAVKNTRHIDIGKITDFSDQEVFKLWKIGDTIGIFQFESEGITKLMKEISPDSLEDIIAGVSIYRPGPMDQIPKFIMGKRNKEKIQYLDESLKDILEVTNGCVIYQEQVMEIFRKLAGYNLGEADIVRRAISKKKIDVMENEREKFIIGCSKNNISREKANIIFEKLAEFAKYAFNKSHAGAYAILAYHTAYLKRYFTQEFLSATMNSFSGNLEKISMYIEDARKHKICILPPDINYSYTCFCVDTNFKNNYGNFKNIRFGLDSIKNVGINISKKIIEEREKNGKYLNFIDFLRRTKNMGITKKILEALILVGAFDSLNIERTYLLAEYEEILESIKSYSDDQLSFFADDNDSELKQMNEEDILGKIQPMKESEKLKYEKEYLGVYVSSHPLNKYKELITKNSTITTEVITKILKNNLKIDRYKNYTIAGIIDKKAKKISKKGNKYYILKLEDLFSTIDILILDSNIIEKIENISENTIVKVVGKLNIKENSATIIAENIFPAKRIE